MVLGEGEVMMGVEPAMVGVTKAFEGSQLQHGGAPLIRWNGAMMRVVSIDKKRKYRLFNIYKYDIQLC
jgi:hypothetical protein